MKLRYNLNHLYYFWVIVREKGISGASEKLRLSQPALSLQLRQLEEACGHKLFERVGRRLVLSDYGSQIYPAVDDLFHSASHVQEVLEAQGQGQQKILKVGASASLSKNLQYQFFAPLLEGKGVQLDIFNGQSADLSKKLSDFELDLVLTNTPLSLDGRVFVSREIAEFPCVLVSKRARLDKSVEEILKSEPLFLPAPGSILREKIESYFGENEIKPKILAEIDDTALLRLFITNGSGVGVIPSIGVFRDIQKGEVKILGTIPGISETFYLFGKRKTFEAFQLEKLIIELRRSVKKLSKG